MKRVLSLILLLTILMGCLLTPSNASAASKTTGIKKGAILGQSHFEIGASLGAIIHVTPNKKLYSSYTDVYISEKYLSKVFVKYAPSSYWTRISETNHYTLSENVTITRTGNVAFDLLKKLGFKASITLSKSTSTTGANSIKPSTSNTEYTYCRPCISCDYYEITFERKYYLKNKVIETKKMTERIPVSGTQSLTYKYK